VEIDSRFTANPDGCIRCARCQRICKIQSSEAIALVGRSASRSVTGPFHRPPEDCLGCLACAINCPAGCISFKDDGFTRTIWEREFALLPCPVCGERVFTKEQLDFFHVESPLCPECRKRAFAKDLKRNEFIVGYKAPPLPSHLAFEKTK
jgi:ferredoxin